jgi:uncharacterized protein (DUF2141 family)
MNRRRLALLAALAALLGALAASSSAAGQTAGCVPGVRTIDGVNARVFCGTAKATVHVGAKTLSFANGACDTSSFGYSVNIGTFFAGTSKSTRPYFGLAVEKAKPGTYARQTVSFRSGGVSRSAFVTVTLKTLRSGTFSGSVIFGGPRVSGTFSC